MEETNAIPGAVVEGTTGNSVPAPQNGQPAPTPAPPPIDWQKRYGGLQESLNKLYQRTGFKSLDEIPDATTWQGWKTTADQLVGLQRETQEMKTTHDNLAADYEVQTGELSGLRNQMAKLELLAEKYPELMRFHKFIPTTDLPEGQEEAIQQFQATLGSYTQSRTPAAAPPPGAAVPAGGSASLEEQVRQAWLEYNNATMSGKSRQEIQALFDAYSQLQSRYTKETGKPDRYAAPRARAIE